MAIHKNDDQVTWSTAGKAEVEIMDSVIIFSDYWIKTEILQSLPSTDFSHYRRNEHQVLETFR